MTKTTKSIRNEIQIAVGLCSIKSKLLILKQLNYSRNYVNQFHPSSTQQPLTITKVPYWCRIHVQDGDTPKNAWDMVIIFILIKIYIMAGNHTGLANWQCPTRSIKHSPLSTWPNEAKICTPPAANTSLVAASSNLRPFSILIHLILFIWCLFSWIYTYTCRIHVRLFLKNAVFPYPRFSIPVLVSPYHVT